MQHPPPRGSTPSAADLAEMVYGPSVPDAPPPAEAPEQVPLQDRLRSVVAWTPAAGRFAALAAALTAVVLATGACRGWWRPDQRLAWAAAVTAAGSVLADQAAGLVLRLRSRREAGNGG